MDSIRDHLHYIAAHSPDQECSSRATAVILEIDRVLGYKPAYVVDNEDGDDE